MLFKCFNLMVLALSRWGPLQRSSTTVWYGFCWQARQQYWLNDGVIRSYVGVVGPCMLSVSLPPGHAPFSPSDAITPRALFTMVGKSWDHWCIWVHGPYPECHQTWRLSHVFVLPVSRGISHHNCLLDKQQLRQRESHTHLRPVEKC